MSEQTPIKLADLEEAPMFTGADGFDTAAWVCRATGKVLWHRDDTDEFGALPEDIDDEALRGGAGQARPRAGQATGAGVQPHAAAGLLRRGARHIADFKDLLGRHDSLDAWQQRKADQIRQAPHDWFKIHPELFSKMPKNQAGLDS